MSKFKFGDVVKWYGCYSGRIVVAEPCMNGNVVVDCDGVYALVVEKLLSLKPKTIKVNGFDVPEPLRVEPENGEIIFLASAESSRLFFKTAWTNFPNEIKWFQRGLLHSTQEAAIAHAKAMLGINPEGG